MQKFEFPKNIKQIGSISDGMKIYMEDYVCSYLQQYSQSSGYDESLAILLGRKMLIDGQVVLFISGAVQGKGTVLEENIQTFTDMTWEYVNEQIEEYFSGMEILGWMQTQPGYGIYLNSNYAKYHFEMFNKPYQVMFVVDPIESVNVFFIAKKDKKELVEAKGYFVYYDKNENMHEYMLENKVKKEKEDYDVSEEMELLYQSETDRAIRFNATKRLKDRSDQKRIVNMLVSVSGVLLVICFVMGIGLIQNGDRITRLEEDILRMSEAYVVLLDAIRGDRVEEVFAEQILAENPVDDDGEATQAAQNDEDVNTEIAETPTETVTTPEPPVETVAAPEPPVETVAAPEPPVEIVAAPEPPIETVATPEPPIETVAAPEPPAPPAEPVEQIREIPATYTVQPGDNLLFISLYFYGTTQMVNSIMAYNNITDPDSIQAGNVLNLPPMP